MSGVVLVTLFVTLVHEDDSRGLPLERIGAAGVLRKYVYNPRKYPDFSWNWLARFFFYFGLTLNTTFTAFFFADRLGISITEVSGVIGTLGGIGVLATTAGALGGGFMSDRFRRRKVFLVLGGAIMAVGMVTMAMSSDLPFLFAGSLIVSLGIGLFAAVDMALLLDVLPEKQTDAGRFMGITGFATSIPQAARPVHRLRHPPHRGDRRRQELLAALHQSPRPSCSSADSSSFASARSADPARPGESHMSQGHTGRFITPTTATGTENEPAAYLRREFRLEHLPARATLRVTALGVVEAHLNGAVIGDEILTPGVDVVSAPSGGLGTRRDRRSCHRRQCARRDRGRRVGAGPAGVGEQAQPLR